MNTEKGDVTDEQGAAFGVPMAELPKPLLAHKLLLARGKSGMAARGEATYAGDGSGPLTVERGEIVLAAFACGGKLAPRFPTWLIDGTRLSALAWSLKERILPPLVWEGMPKGREWLAQPEMVG